MRLIDADALIKNHPTICSRDMKFNLDLAPTIDAVEVIRCISCKHFIKVPSTGYTGCELHEHLMSTNGYCSWGKLKESEVKQNEPNRNIQM